MQPFSSIKVVDLTHVIAGPFCTYQLAVMGADVIKIESPYLPDMVRPIGNEFPGGKAGLSPNFTAQNSNKRSVAIDLKSENGLSIVKALIARADVLVENYRTGAMEKLGLDYESVKTIRPDIIYCSLTGYGQTGPLAERTAYDNVIQAFSGLMAATGSEETGPIKVGPPVLDYGTGIQAAYAIAAALFQRTQTGEGQRIDIAMLDAALMLMSTNVTGYQYNRKLNPITGNMSAFNAGYGCYETQEGMIMIGAYTGIQVKNLWVALGEEGYGEQFANAETAGLGDNIERDTEKLKEILQQKTAPEWEVILNAHRVPAARVRYLDETLGETQVNQRQIMQTPPGAEYALPTAAFAFRNSDGAKLNRPPPVHGQHTKQVLTELGYNETEITELESQNIIVQS